MVTAVRSRQLPRVLLGHHSMTVNIPMMAGTGIGVRPRQGHPWPRASPLYLRYVAPLEVLLLEPADPVFFLTSVRVRVNAEPLAAHDSGREELPEPEPSPEPASAGLAVSAQRVIATAQRAPSRRRKHLRGPTRGRGGRWSGRARTTAAGRTLPIGCSHVPEPDALRKRQLLAAHRAAPAGIKPLGIGETALELAAAKHLRGGATDGVAAGTAATTTTAVAVLLAAVLSGLPAEQGRCAARAAAERLAVPSTVDIAAPRSRGDSQRVRAAVGVADAVAGAPAHPRPERALVAVAVHAPAGRAGERVGRVAARAAGLAVFALQPGERGGYCDSCERERREAGSCVKGVL